MGHIGLTPQAISVLGGFRAQGRTALKARDLLDEALALQAAGCFALVIECCPANVAAEITKALEIPTIGIGSGVGCGGQVLVYHDMLGMTTNPHHEQFVPKFCKSYATLGDGINRALREYKADVEGGVFPSEDYSPYKMSAVESELFEEMVGADARERKDKKVKEGDKRRSEDEYDVLKLYGSK